MLGFDNPSDFTKITWTFGAGGDTMEYAQLRRCFCGAYFPTEPTTDGGFSALRWTCRRCKRELTADDVLLPL